MDLGNVGFQSDTGPLKDLNTTLDTTKAKVQGLNEELNKTNSAAQGASSGIDKVTQSAKSAGDSYKQAGSGAEQFSAAATKVISSLDQQITKTQLTSAEMRVLQALQQSGATLETAAGQAIAQRALVLDQALTKTKASTVGTAEFGVALAALFPNLTKTASEADRVATAHGGISSQTQAAMHSVRSMAESLALGISPAQALTQQLNHLSYAASGPGGITGAFAGIVSMIGPGGLILGGIAAATAAFLGLDYAVSKSAQEVQSAKNRLESLGGVKLGGEMAKSLESTVKELGIARDAAQPVYDAFTKLINLRSPEGGIQILGPGLPAYLDQTKVNAESVKTAFAAVYEQLKLGDATTKQATIAATQFLSEVAKAGNLTGDALRKLENSGEGGYRAAQSITSAMTSGKLNTEQFAAALDKVPEKLTTLLDRLRQLEAGSAPAFKELEEHPKTVQGAVEKLNRSFDALWDSVTGRDKPQQGAASVALITKGISAAADGVGKLDVERVKTFKTVIEDAFSAMASFSSGALGPLKILGEAIGYVGGKFLDVYPSVRAFGTTIAEFVSQSISDAKKWASDFASAVGDGVLAGLQSIAKFVSDSMAAVSNWTIGGVVSSIFNGIVQTISGAVDAAIAKIQSLVSAAISGGQQAAQAIGGSVSASGGTGGTEGLGMGAYMQPAGSAGTADLGNNPSGVTDNLPAFASGGSFTVGGSGGTDSQLIQFMATPGEQVSVDPPGSSGIAGAAKTTLGSLIPSNDNTPSAQGDIVSAHISEDFKTQTAAINDKLGTIKDAVVNAITSLGTTFKTVMSSTTIATATTGAGSTATLASTSTSGTIASTATAASGGGATLSGGGGGGGKSGNTGGGQEKEQPLTPAQQQALADEGRGIARGTGSALSGPVDANGNFRFGGQTLVDANGNFVSRPQTRTITASTTTNPGNGRNPDTGLIYPPFTGPMDASGLPIGSTSGLPGGLGNLASRSDLFGIGELSRSATGGLPGGLGGIDARSGGVVDTGFADRFDALGNKTTEATQQQTDALKQAYLDANRTVADTVKDQIDNTKTIGDKTNDQLRNVDQSAQDTARTNDNINQATLAGNQATTSGFGQTTASLDGVGAGVGETTSAVSSGSGDIVSSVNSLGGSIAQAVAGAVSGAGGIRGGTSGSGASPAGALAGDNIVNGVNMGQDFSVVQGTGSFTSSTPDATGNFTPTTAANSAFMQGVGISGDSVPLFQYAIGGQFKVKGAGGTDTEHVEFMASPGETVTITPPGGTPPPNPSMAGTPTKKSGIMAFATGGQFTLGAAVGEPTLAGADIVAAHLADNTRSQTADLKDKLDQIAAKVIEAITAGANSIRNTVTAALAQMAADAKAVASANSQTTSGAGTTGGGLNLSSFQGGGAGNRLGGFGTALLDGTIVIHNGVDRAGAAAAARSGGVNPSFTDRNGVSLSPFAGMSEGGAFVVPGGTGGSDIANVVLKASPGEHIFAVPGDKAKQFEDMTNTIRVTPEPLSKFLPRLQDNIPGGGSGIMSSPASGSSAAAVAAYGTAGRADGKDVNVNFYMQSKQQADDFIRSRAEIQRIMRG